MTMAIIACARRSFLSTTVVGCSCTLFPNHSLQSYLIRECHWDTGDLRNICSIVRQLFWTKRRRAILTTRWDRALSHHSVDFHGIGLPYDIFTKRRSTAERIPLLGYGAPSVDVSRTHSIHVSHLQRMGYRWPGPLPEYPHPWEMLHGVQPSSLGDETQIFLRSSPANIDISLSGILELECLSLQITETQLPTTVTVYCLKSSREYFQLTDAMHYSTLRTMRCM